MNDLMTYIIEEHGLPKNQRKLSPDELNSLPAAIPPILRELFSEHGVFSTVGGRIQTCHPCSLQEIIRLTFGDDKEFNSNLCHAFAYSAFGNIYFFHQDFGLGEIELVEGSVLCEVSSMKDETKANRDRSVEIPFMLDSSDLDAYDDDDKALFSRAKKNLGELQLGECYGFHPLLSLGGINSVNNLQKTKAMEHFSLLCQSQEYSLFEYSSYGNRKLIKTF